MVRQPSFFGNRRLRGYSGANNGAAEMMRAQLLDCRRCPRPDGVMASAQRTLL